MKKFSLLIAVVILTSATIFVQRANAQQSDAGKEKEYKIQMELEQQKKAMTEQKKAMTEQKKAEEEMLKELKENQKAMEKSYDVRVEIPDIPDVPDIPDIDMDNDIVRVFGRRGDRSAGVAGEPFIWSSGTGNFHTFNYGDNNQMTRWEFSKNVKESTFSKEYGIDVEKSAKSVVMSINGDCKSGEIRIKITMPSGKTYSEILIDESGNLNWRKSFSITDTENQDKAGEWKYQISSNKATGYFKISLQTN